MTLNKDKRISPLLTVDVAELSQKLAVAEISARELVHAHLERIHAVEPKVHAFLHINDEKALEVADDVDNARAHGEPLHPLAGIPIAIKDLIVTQDEPTTAASKMLEGWVSPYDATVVTKIKKARLPILGKTNLDEFAMGSSTEHSAYGVTRNPWDLERTPGGSGGGSAAAVAAFEAPFALGTDTGGSIRQPAAVTGTVGVKSTYGAVSRYGSIALASSLDQIGSAARSVLDAAMLQELISGHDPKDSTSLPQDSNDLVAAAAIGEITGVRIGVVKELGGEGYQNGVRAGFQKALELLEGAGAEIIEISAPNFGVALGAYYVIMPSEASSNLAKFDGVRYGVRVVPEGNPTIEKMVAATRAAGFGYEVKRRILLGTYALSAGYYDAYYRAAQKARALVQQDFKAAFEKTDVILTPTTPVTAFKFGEKLTDPMAMYMNDVATIPASLAGIPGLSLPAGLAPENGLPVGVQILAPAQEDARVYRVGAVLEELFKQQWGGPLLDRALAL